MPREIVGNTKVKGIECIQTLQQYKAKKRSGGIHRFFKTAKPIKKTKNDNVNNANLQHSNYEERKIDAADRNDELQKAIEASKVSFKMNEEKRGKKRKFDEVDGLNDLDELEISKNKKVNSKKQKLNK